MDKSYKNFEVIKIRNINISRTAAIIRLIFSKMALLVLFLFVSTCTGLYLITGTYQASRNCAPLITTSLIIVIVIIITIITTITIAIQTIFNEGKHLIVGHTN